MRRFHWTGVLRLAVCIVLLRACGPVYAAAGPINGPNGPHVEQVSDANLLLGPQGQVVRRSPNPIHDVQLIETSTSDIDILLWEEGVGTPYYAIARNGHVFGEPRRARHTLMLRDGERDPASSPPSAPDGVMGNHGDLYVVQFVTPPEECFAQEIEALGADVLNFFPYQARIVRMSADIRRQVRRLPYVRWVGPYHAAYRLDAQTRSAATASNAIFAPQRYNIELFDGAADRMTTVADRIVGMGGLVDFVPVDGRILEASLTPSQLASVASLDEVLFIDSWAPPVSHMSVVRDVGGANYIESVAGYTGFDVHGEVQDDGCLITHPDFATRILVRNGPVPVDDPNHGTSTFGIIFGDGTGNPQARGMIPDGNGIFSSYTFTGSRYSNLVQLASPAYECLFQSNSWGAGINVTGTYTTYASNLDDAIFDLDLLILHSHGNSGTRTTSPEPWAKNVVSVGGVFHYNTATTADDEWYHPVFGAASIGPASDGRIKPDLCQFFDQIRTTKNTGGYISDFGGTSASCAIVAGHFGLLYEMWADGIFGNPVLPSGSPYSERPHNATARALMINTARSYDFSGTSDDLTRTHQGWGLPDLQRLYDQREQMMVVDETDILLPGETARYARRINVDDSSLRVTLVYTDFHGTTSALLHRVNDLSLRVEAPDGTVYYGNNGLLTGNESTSGGLPNGVDTVENVWLTSPMEGVWTITVSADEVNEDGHPETVSTVDADFALVVSGGEDCPPPAFDAGGQPQSITYACPDGEDDVTLTASVTDYTGLQWFQEDVPLPGEMGESLTLFDITAQDLGTYYLRATNTCGERWSDAAEIADPGPPTIIGQPTQGGPRCVGDDASMIVTASGIGPLAYQWYHDGEPVSGATGATISFLPLDEDDDGSYFCRISNLCYSIDSDSVDLDVVALPVFIEHPANVDAVIGETLMLHVEADADGPLVYQWRKVGVTGTIGAGPTLTILDAQLDDAGEYYAVAFTLSPICTAESDTATVTVSHAPCDQDLDGDCDLRDMSSWVGCFGPAGATQPNCDRADLVGGDGDVDLSDWAAFLEHVSGPR